MSEKKSSNTNSPPKELFVLATIFGYAPLVPVAAMEAQLKIVE